MVENSLIIFLILVIILIICPELSCSRSVQSTTDQSFGWTLYRFYPYDRWSWYRWCIWTCLEDFGVKGASTLCTAAATFGLIAGSIMGGPVGKRLIEKKNLLKTAIPEDNSL